MKKTFARKFVYKDELYCLGYNVCSQLYTGLGNQEFG